MYRVFINENDTPYFNYPTPVVKYLNWELIVGEYDVLVPKGFACLQSLYNHAGEGEEYQLAVL